MAILSGSNRILTEKQLVKEYFRRIPESPEATLALFMDDAIIYEPFSTENSLVGKAEIGHFLRVARMANRGLQKKISTKVRGKNRIEARVQFTRGGTVKGKFQFKTKDIQTQNGINKKIKELKIEFMR